MSQRILLEGARAAASSLSRDEGHKEAPIRATFWALIHEYEAVVRAHERCDVRHDTGRLPSSAEPVRPAIPDVECNPECHESKLDTLPETCERHARARRDALVTMVARLEDKVRWFRQEEGRLSRGLYEALKGITVITDEATKVETVREKSDKQKVADMIAAALLSPLDRRGQ